MKKKEEEALIHRKTVSATGSTVYCITHEERCTAATYSSNTGIRVVTVLL